MPHDSARPSADALLNESQRHERGRLKIFLGAAPGVGKTFEMLTQARRKQAEGVDVVVGIVETHGRKETQALLEGLPQLPMQSLTHRGRTLNEFDLDAALARKPQLLLVDELAHSNLPGARHAKRYQDVQELLEAGVDIYTTLNVQHLDSYNDLVERITGVEVRETVPEALLDLATDIELIDLPPDDLIEHLHQGKVYVPEQARRALDNFFSRGNLLALRELALRAAAARVDDEMANFMRARGIAGPWPARGRLLVCIDASRASEDLLRSASRLAEQRRLPWIALHVQTLGRVLSPAQQQQLENNLALAAQLGGDSITITANRVGMGVIDYAKACNAAQIVVGRPRRWYLRGWRISLAEWLFRHAPQFEITVASTGTNAPNSIADPVRHAPRHGVSWINEREVLWAMGSTLGTTLIALMLRHWLNVDDLSALFIFGVAVAGGFGGLTASLLTCALSFCAYNFFFTSPMYTLMVSRASDVRTLVVFLIVGGAVGILSGQLRRQESDARHNTLRTARLFDFMRRIAHAMDERDLREAAASGITDMLGMQCHVLTLTADKRVRIPAELARSTHWRDTDTAAANWAAEHRDTAGANTTTLPAAAWTFVPVVSTDHSLAVIALQPHAGGRALTAENRRLLHTLQALLATTWERFELLKLATEARERHAAENLRGALLASVSHDLRTPLASVMGSLSAMHELQHQLSEHDQQRLVATALHEAQRLNRLIQNLLDATRLAQGALRLNMVSLDVTEVLHSALQHLPEQTRGRIVLDLPASLPPVRGDHTLLQQTLINLLENALKYSGDDAPVTVTATEQSGQLHIRIHDLGIGMTDTQRKRAFDFFYRAHQPDMGDTRVAGTGLGLAICKGFVDAMGGSITVSPANVHPEVQTEAHSEIQAGSIFTVALAIDHHTQPEPLSA